MSFSLPRTLLRSPPTSLSRTSCRLIPIRTFTSTPIYRNPNPPSPSSKDPSHPYLHYHPTATHLTLSFLPDPPVQRSRTILGYLPLENATLEDFKEEPRFLDTLHEAIQSGLEAGKADSVMYEAETRPTDGWIHITDERAIPPAGRIGETEDLIGSVYVQDGKIIASTYSPLPTYRIITPNGVLTLPKGLDEHLIEVLRKIDREEKK
ncbi:hypothetical protein I302_100350 [Kwoniella bestiolae CBS 10118]|uniref:Uncharacterized protein n=1 Tax=Kwoniella bestiolae CBS 10118 TaxID=1296100 RepID=A0A1B9G4T5_9TREE|nr:hypothetical protein I302_03722 [Kwoniella bestiolae CBS 10118]OCF26045.1 hypothetical protein I302_03722 [Kwoniella bestiolae CBS 10118]